MSKLIVGDVETNSINGGPLAGFRNAIINGNFAVNQRGVSGTVTLSAGAYGHDRWKAGASGCTYTFATSANVTTLTITAGSLVQVIEGASLFSGTYTLSFTGTAQGKIGAGSFGDSGITGSATGGTNLAIEFNTGTVSQVQLEPGSVATPFERRPVGTELALCQRYFCRTRYVVRFSATGAGQIFENSIYWPQTMRANPTTTLDATGTVNGTATVLNPNSFAARASLTSSGSGDVRLLGALVTADAEL